MSNPNVIVTIENEPVPGYSTYDVYYGCEVQFLESVEYRNIPYEPVKLWYTVRLHLTFSTSTTNIDYLLKFINDSILEIKEENEGVKLRILFNIYPPSYTMLLEATGKTPEELFAEYNPRFKPRQ